MSDIRFGVIYDFRRVPGSTIAPLEGAPGFWLVDAGTIAQGLTMCTGLDGWFGDDAVYLDVRQPHAPRVARSAGVDLGVTVAAPQSQLRKQ